MAAKSPFKRLSDRQRELVEKHIRYAECVAIKFSRSEYLLEDCKSVARLKLVECAARYKEKATFKTFIYKQIAYAVVDFERSMVRARGYRRSACMPPKFWPILEDFHERNSEYIGRFGFNFESVDSRDEWDFALSKVSNPTYRRLFQLVYECGHSQEEVGKMYGFTKGTVRRYCYVAREEIRASFASESGQSKV